MAIKSFKVNDKDGTVTIVADYKAPTQAPLSSSGKSVLCASTGGFTPLAAGDIPFKLNLVLTADPISED